MPHIDLPAHLPGITAGFAFRPETAAPMRALAHVLLHQPGRPSALSSRDRELIATFVSSRNDCYFCRTSHGAAAAHLTQQESPDGRGLVEAVCRDYRSAPISELLKSLLAIAAAVQVDGKRVTTELVSAARDQGASDLDIHDTVLIAAAFCMYNRYVDGLGTWQPQDPAMYTEMGRHMAEEGYVQALVVAR